MIRWSPFRKSDQPVRFILDDEAEPTPVGHLERFSPLALANLVGRLLPHFRIGRIPGDYVQLRQRGDVFRLGLSNSQGHGQGIFWYEAPGWGKHVDDDQILAA